MKISHCMAAVVLALALPVAAQEPLDPQLAALLAEAAQNNPDLQKRWLAISVHGGVRRRAAHAR